MDSMPGKDDTVLYLLVLKLAHAKHYLGSVGVLVCRAPRIKSVYSRRVRTKKGGGGGGGITL